MATIDKLPAICCTARGDYYIDTAPLPSDDDYDPFSAHVRALTEDYDDVRIERGAVRTIGQIGFARIVTAARQAGPLAGHVGHGRR
jgi:hypothetical protein